VGWRRLIFEGFVSLNRLFSAQGSEPPQQPETIFILRNNDIGDLLVVTPLFEALKKKFPNAKLLVGIGLWNREVLIVNAHEKRCSLGLSNPQQKPE